METRQNLFITFSEASERNKNNFIPFFLGRTFHEDLEKTALSKNQNLTPTPHRIGIVIFCWNLLNLALQCYTITVFVMILISWTLSHDSYFLNLTLRILKWWWKIISWYVIKYEKMIGFAKVRNKAKLV